MRSGTFKASVCLAAAAVLSGCESIPPGGPPGGPGGELTLVIPWMDVPLGSATAKKTVHVTHGGQVYHAEYGADPTGGAAAAAQLVDGGRAWRQSHGFFYIWGQW